MSKKLEVFWEVSDGYVGNSRPQSTFVPYDDIQACGELSEAMQLIDDAIQDDFEQHPDQRKYRAKKALQ